MATLKQEAQAYEPTQPAKNLAELEEVPVDIELETRTGTDKETQEPYTYKVAKIEGEYYKIPFKVIGDIKSFLKVIPTLKTFKVLKEGTGIKTRYTTIPLKQ